MGYLQNTWNDEDSKFYIFTILHTCVFKKIVITVQLKKKVCFEGTYQNLI